ncbi:MAG: DUF3857 domain-containing protein, partial [Chitinophagaceae bacterium]
MVNEKISGPMRLNVRRGFLSLQQQRYGNGKGNDQEQRQQQVEGPFPVPLSGRHKQSLGVPKDRGKAALRAEWRIFDGTLMRPFFLLFLLFAAFSGSAQRVATAAAPSWVTRHNFDYAATSLDDGAGDGYIDIAFEKQVSVATQTVFIRTARRVLSDAGVQNASEVSVDYDPGYEQVTLHSVQLRRAGQVIDKLKSGRFQVMRQERERSEHLYTGMLTALLVLDDVRQGDVIEYSYSIHGFNPVFGNRYATEFDTRFSVPVYFIYYKVLAPAGRSLAVHNRGDGPAAKPVSAGAEQGWEWELHNSKALQMEDRVPGWYDPYPVIEVSEWRSWKEVIDWATTLFPQTTAPAVAKLAAEW